MNSTPTDLRERLRDMVEAWREEAKRLAGFANELHDPASNASDRTRWRQMANQANAHATALEAALPVEPETPTTCRSVYHNKSLRAACGLPAGHPQDHRAEFAYGSVQWPREAAR